MFVSSTQFRRWKCPRCDTGRNAPSRMAADDSRRYCFPCSEQTGKLVRMVCPTLERQRAARKVQREEKRRREKDKAVEQAAARHTLDDGTNLLEVFDRARRLQVWAKEGGPRVAAKIKHTTFDLRTATRSSGHSGYGDAWNNHIVLTVSRSRTGDDVTHDILHELAHVCKGSGGKRDRRPHDHNFHALLLAVCHEWWPALRDHYELVQSGYRANGGARRAYSMDRAIKAVVRNLNDPEALERCRAKWASDRKVVA